MDLVKFTVFNKYFKVTKKFFEEKEMRKFFKKKSIWWTDGKINGQFEILRNLNCVIKSL